MKHHLNENRPVWTRVSSRFSEQRQSWPALPVSLLTLAIWLYSVTPATAASIVVDNPGDSHVIGKISLREALQRVSAPDDVITFAPDIYVIRLSAELGIERAVTIRGLDFGYLAVVGQPGNRVFNIAATGQAIISGLGIEVGSVTGNGGAIFNSGTLTLSRCWVYGSTATAYGAMGGGIFNSGTLILDSSDVTDCAANGSEAKGGGIFNSGTLTIRFGTVLGCVANGPGAEGGGIFNQGTLSLFDSEVWLNSVPGTDASGGGIYNRGSLDLTTTRIHGNQTSAGGLGGGVSNAGGDIPGKVTITQSAISDNTAMAGAGIFNLGNTSINRSTIDNNHASLSGGGIINEGTLTVTNIMRANRIREN